MKQVDVLQKAIEKLNNFTYKKHLLVGFDGFVDEIIHVVNKRKNKDEYERIRDITGFSERIASVAGLSANIELVPIQTKLGGNGPIMANSIIAQGQDVTYIGAIGNPYIDPVFKPFADSCRRVISLTDPGHTDALEFYDGKIMLGKMNNLVDVNIDNLLEESGKEELEKILSEVDMVAFTNWTMLANLNGIIEYFGELMENMDNRPSVFIDLADPKKRTNEDIEKVLELISDLPTDTILGMNMSESGIISEVLGIKAKDARGRAEGIRKQMGISCVVIHPVNGAAVSHEKETLWVEGPYTEEPRLTTGAGDNFNAGFCNAWLGGFEPGECLIAGVCTSGFYVRNARSPARDELLGFMNQWHASGCGDI